MRVFFRAFAPFLLALPMPVLAQQDPGELACMEQSYTAEQQADLAQLKREFTLDEGSDVSERLGNIVSQAALDCFLANEWNEDGTYYAVLYEMGRQSEAGFRTSGALSQEDRDKIDTALAKSSHEEMWTLLERGVIAGVDGTEPEYTAREQFTMGLFVVAAGIPADDEKLSENIGVLLGFMALQRYARREFSSAEGGQ